METAFQFAPGRRVQFFLFYLSINVSRDFAQFRQSSRVLTWRMSHPEAMFLRVRLAPRGCYPLRAGDPAPLVIASTGDRRGIAFAQVGCCPRAGLRRRFLRGAQVAPTCGAATIVKWRVHVVVVADGRVVAPPQTRARPRRMS